MRILHLACCLCAAPVLAIGHSRPPISDSSDSGRAAGARSQQPTRQGQRLLCGRRYTRPPAITATSVGPVRLEMTIEQARRLCPEAVDTVDSLYSTPAIRLDFMGSVVLVIPDYGGQGGRAEGPVANIRVVGGPVATPQGIRAGATLGRLRRVYGRPVFTMCGARPLGAKFRRVPYTWFLFAPLENCSNAREDPGVVVPDSMRVTAIEIFVEQ